MANSPSTKPTLLTRYQVLVLDLLGPNLEDLFDMCGRKFTIKTVCMLAKQMVRIHLYQAPLPILYYPLCIASE